MLFSRAYLAQYLDLKNVNDEQLVSFFNALGHEVVDVNKISYSNLQIAEIQTCQTYDKKEKTFTVTYTLLVQQNQIGTAIVKQKLKVHQKVLVRFVDHDEKNLKLCSGKMIGVASSVLHADSLVLLNQNDVKQLGSSFELQDSIFDLELTYNHHDAYSGHQLVLELAYFLHQTDGFYRHNIHVQYSFGLIQLNQISSHANIKIKIDDNLKPMINHCYVVQTNHTTKQPLSFTSVYLYSLLQLNLIESASCVQWQQIMVYHSGQPLGMFHTSHFNNILKLTVNSDRQLSFVGNFEGKHEMNTTLLLIALSVKPSFFQNNQIPRLNANYHNSCYLVTKNIAPANYASALLGYLHYHNDVFTGVGGGGFLHNAVHAVIVKVNIVLFARCLGITLPKKDLISFFQQLNFKIKFNAPDLICTVPFNRTHINQPWDIVEEFFRFYNVNQIPDEAIGQDQLTFKSTCPERDDWHYDQISRFFINQGFTQHKTFALVSEKEIKDYNFFQFKNLIYIDHAISKQHQALRVSLLPSLLKNLSFNNKHYQDDLNIFTLDRVFYNNEKEITHHLALLIQGSGLRDVVQRINYQSNFYVMKNGLHQICRFYQMPTDNLQFIQYQTTLSTEQEMGFDSQKTFFIQSNNTTIGLIGMLHQEGSKLQHIKPPCSFLELKLNNFPQLQFPTTTKSDDHYYQPRVFHPIVRDFTYQLPDQLKYKHLLNHIKTILASDQKYLVQINLKDLYATKTKVNVRQTITLKLMFYDHHKQIKNNFVNKIMNKLEQKLNLLQNST